MFFEIVVLQGHARSVGHRKHHAHCRKVDDKRHIAITQKRHRNPRQRHQSQRAARNEQKLNTGCQRNTRAQIKTERLPRPAGVKQRPVNQHKQQQENNHQTHPTQLFGQTGQNHVGVGSRHRCGKPFAETLTRPATRCQCPETMGQVIAPIYVVVPGTKPHGFAVGKAVANNGDLVAKGKSGQYQHKQHRPFGQQRQPACACCGAGMAFPDE